MVSRAGTISRSVAGLLSLLFFAGCSDTPNDTQARYAGKTVELVPLSVQPAAQDSADGCRYTWLNIAGHVNGHLTTVFLPFRRNLGREPRCRTALTREIAALIEAEINDGDEQSISLCVKEFDERADIELPAGGRRFEAVELAVSGWYFRKPIFWSCNDEPGCPPPDSCELLSPADPSAT
jgi:hypothetical protein